MKHSMTLVLGLALLGPAAAEAQEPPRAGSGVRSTAPYSYVTSRPHLGFSVTTRPTASDTIGARVESVTPGSPAFRAGIRSGDVITRINGHALVARMAPGVRTLSPGTRLLEVAARISPEDTVALQLRRGSSVRNVRLIAEPRRDIMVYYEEPIGQEHALRELRQRVEEARGQTMTLDRNRALLETAISYSFSPFGNLQLAPLNEDLGRYFGTSEGILVISVAQSSALSLRGGDVVIRVDGRAPESPAHLLRILGSYGPGEELRLEIFRDRKRRTVTGSVGGAKEMLITP